MRVAVPFHPALEDEYRCHPVDSRCALVDANLALAEDAVGLRRGQAFGPKVNGQLKTALQLCRKLAHFPGLRSFCAAKAQRQTDYDFPHFVALNQRFEGGKV